MLAQFVPDSPQVGVLCEPSAEPVGFAVDFHARDFPDSVDVVAPDESPTACGQLSSNTYDLVREFARALPHGRGEIAVGRAEVTISPASP